jgi:hypothetical protein
LFLHGEKDKFEEYFLYLESAEFSYATLINYSTGKYRTCPWSMICCFSSNANFVNYNCYFQQKSESLGFGFISSVLNVEVDKLISTLIFVQADLHNP